MRFYHIQPSELEGLGDLTKRALLLHIDRIKAREHLEQLNILQSLLAKDDDRQQFLLNLAEIAFADDERTRATYVEAITRRR